MTEKLTTAEVRLAATTNVDLPLTLYKKLESGFDAWLASVQIESARKALAAVGVSGTPSSNKPSQPQKAKPSTAVNAPKPPMATVKPTAPVKTETVNGNPKLSSDSEKSEGANESAPVRPVKRKRIRPVKRNKKTTVEVPEQ